MTRRDFMFVSASAALAALGAVGTVGCSSSASASSTTQAATTADAYTLVEDGKLTVAWETGFPPMESIPDGQTTPVGFDIDLMTKISEKLGLSCNYLASQKFDTIIPTIKTGGKADVGCASFTITDERKEEIDFSDYYLNSNQSIVAKATSTGTKADDFNVAGTKVAVQAGTTGEAWAQENLSNATLVTLDDAIQCMTGVQTGLYDCCASDLPVLSWMCKSSYTDLKVCVEIPTGEQYGIVVSKDNPALTSAINDAISEMRSDGTLDSLKQQWFGYTDGL
jgi:polar amino acid transport system substrate-binding protein